MVADLGPELVNFAPENLNFSLEDSMNLALRSFPISGVEGSFSVFLYKNAPVTSYLFSIKRDGKRARICSLAIIIQDMNYNPMKLFPICKALIEELTKYRSSLRVKDVSNLVPSFFKMLVDYSTRDDNDFSWESEIKNRVLPLLNGNGK